ncbi:head-tail connector protein [Bacillus sp. FJAT-49705]|uniref:Head-tail connector protein n=1 Tax=Cytobacillus citreus TaxID=2833586 RepID=A0ABS5NXZ1_9BACI|nr:head-tail connector protein [Cytobacillus citreus]MBS4191749.1 head-tail connector protein [Cytobacillus citreus]
MILELNETKEWIRVDGTEEDSIISTIIGAAEEYLEGATGKKFDDTNHRAKIFCLVLVTDWYENRDLIGSKPSEKVRFSIQSMLAQLQYSTEGSVTP